jgi:GNAT superfamily N-acetyltransferase
MDALIVYDVEGGRIARCWVKLGAPRLLRRLDVTIRQANIDDVALLHTLTRAAYSKWVARLGREPKPMAVDYVEAFGRHHFTIAMAGGVAVGLVELAIEHDHVLVVNVAVAPELHGRGVGRVLLKHAEIVALENGRKDLRLYTNKLFAENIALYQKEGYIVDREEAFLGGATVHLLKRI